jgi:hypothetical protein
MCPLLKILWFAAGLADWREIQRRSRYRYFKLVQDNSKTKAVAQVTYYSLSERVYENSWLAPWDLPKVALNYCITKSGVFWPLTFKNSIFGFYTCMPANSNIFDIRPIPSFGLTSNVRNWSYSYSTSSNR